MCHRRLMPPIRLLPPAAGLAPLALLFASALVGQTPTDNPVRSLFPEAFDAATNGSGNVDSYLWTDALPWASATVSTALPNDSGDDLAVIQGEIDALAAAGGGVLFLPAGTYDFSDHLVMRSGVILRGATPVVADAREAAYAPPTQLVFPRYSLDTSTFTPADSRTARTSAFKRIYLAEATSASRAGLVNLDIHRARVDFIQRNGVWGAADKNLLTSRELLIFGNRINNASTPENAVPAATQNAWQIWPDRRAGKIEIAALENALVANNRISDFHYRFYVLKDTSAPIDDFRMPMILPGADTPTNRAQVYLASNSGGTLLPQTILTQIRDANIDDGNLAYGFADGYGLKVNRSGETGYTDHEIAGISVPEGATPVYEPSLYRRGFVVRQNWIYNPTRVAYHLAGDGMEVRDNVKMDDPEKIAYIHEAGLVWKVNSGTIECRGFDLTGPRFHVVGNYLDVRRYKLAYTWRPTQQDFQYRSTDGEGILLQQSGGGAGVIDWLIEHNTLRGTGYLGIYKIPHVDGLIIRHNDVQINNGDVPAMAIWAYQGGNPGFARRVIIEDNTFTSGSSRPDIELISPLLASQVSIRRNQVRHLITIPNYDLGDPTVPNETVYVADNTLLDGTTPIAPTLSQWTSYPAANLVPEPPNVSDLTFTPSTYGPGDTVTVSVRASAPIFTGVPLSSVRFYDGTRLTATSRGREFNLNDPANYVDLVATGEEDWHSGTWVVPDEIARGLPVVEARLGPFQVHQDQAAATAGTVIPVTLINWAFDLDTTPAVIPPRAPVAVASLDGTTIRLNFTTEAGVNYQLRTVDTLGGTWQPVGEPVIGDGQPAELSAPVSPTATQQFYDLEASR